MTVLSIKRTLFQLFHCFHSLIILLFIFLLQNCHPAAAAALLPSPPHHATLASSSSSTSQHHSMNTPTTSAAASWSVTTTSLGHYVKVVNCSDQGLTSLLDAAIPHDTESIDLSHNQLNDLHNKIPTAVSEHLLHLDVSFNEIRQLGRTGAGAGGHIFTNFTHLRHLDLSGNHLKTLFAGVFRGMKRLETLIMRQGDLKYIDEHAFDGLENLRHLDLESNQIASIYLELFQSILNLRVSPVPFSLPSSLYEILSEIKSLSLFVSFCSEGKSRKK